VSKRLGKVVKGFSSRLQIDSVFICIERCEWASKRLFAFHKGQTQVYTTASTTIATITQNTVSIAPPSSRVLCRRREDSYVTLAA
jgi:hypothetical protein